MLKNDDRVIVLPGETTATDVCPQCGASPDRRVKSAGFGRPHDVCGQCGYETFTRQIVSRGEG